MKIDIIPMIKHDFLDDLHGGLTARAYCPFTIYREEEQHLPEEINAVPDDLHAEEQQEHAVPKRLAGEIATLT